MVFGRNNKEWFEHINTWRTWFAWYPVGLFQAQDIDGDNGKVVWWQYIERRGYHMAEAVHPFEYRLIKKQQ